MEEDVIRCGNDLRWLEWWLHHPGPGPGDPRIKDLAALTQAVVQVLASSQIENQKLAREFRFEASEAVRSAAKQFAEANAAAAHA